MEKIKIYYRYLKMFNNRHRLPLLIIYLIGWVTFLTIPMYVIDVTNTQSIILYLLYLTIACVCSYNTGRNLKVLYLRKYINEL